MYAFFHVNSVPHGEDLFLSGVLDKIFIVYTTVVVILMWELLDYANIRFGIRSSDLSISKNLIRAIGLLTATTLPIVAGTTWLAEFAIKPEFGCPLDEFGNPIPYESGQGAFFKMFLQGQILTWLIIAERLLNINHEQARKSERDKAMMQKELLQSQYVNLKNQVNPHFLFNSFSVLQSLIDTNPDLASKFLTQLTKIFRYMLDNREESMSTLKQELEVLEAYIFLLQIRHGNSLIIEVSIEPEFESTYVPTLALQMLVENAVKHNSFSKEDPMQIRIYVQEEYLVVANKIRQKKADEHSTKVGLENIKSRYKLQAPKPVIITQDTEQFTVKMPILTGLRFS